MSYGAIVRKFYDDGARVIKHREPVYTYYDLFLYETIIRGSMPKYKVRGSNREEVIRVAEQLIENYNLVRINDGYRTVTPYSVSCYNPPIVTNLETGEVE